MFDHQSKNKRIAKNTIILYFRTLLTMLVALYTSRVVLEVLGVEDFGIYNVVGGIIGMFLFINASMIGATQRFLSFELGKNDQEELNKVFSTSLIVHGIIAFIILILGETIGLWFFKTQMNIPVTRMEAAMWVYQFSILTSIIMVISIPYYAVIVAYERMSAFAYLSVVETILKLGIVYLLLVFSQDSLILYAMLMFGVQLSMRALYGFYCKKKIITIRPYWVWDKVLLKKMLAFAGWTMNGNLAYTAYYQGTNILLNIFFGPIVNAARAIAMQVQNVTLGLCRNFQLALNPQITKSFAANDLIYMHKLILASSKYSFFLLFILSLPVFIEAKLLLMWWLKTVPDYTVNFVRLTLLIGLLEVLANPMINAAYATGRIKKFQLWEGSILLLILPISYFVLKLEFVPESVFIVHLVMAIIAQYARLIIVSASTGLSIKKYFSQVILVVFSVSFFASILPVLFYHFYPEENALRVILVCVISLFSAVVTIYFRGLEQTEKSLLKGKIIYVFKNIR